MAEEEAKEAKREPTFSPWGDLPFSVQGTTQPIEDGLGSPTLMERAVTSSPFQNMATASMSEDVRKRLKSRDKNIASLVKKMNEAKDAGNKEEFRRLEDMVREANFRRYKMVRDDRRSNQNVVENFVDDASEILSGFWELSKMAAKGGWATLTGQVSAEDAYESLENIAESLWDGIVDGFEKWEKPGEAFHDRPLESGLDLLAAASLVGSALGAGVSAGGKLATTAKIGNSTRFKWARTLLDIEKKVTPRRPNGQFMSKAEAAREAFYNPVPNLGRVSRALTGGVGDVLGSTMGKVYNKAREVDVLDELIMRLGATMPAKEARKIASRIHKEWGVFMEKTGDTTLKQFRDNFPEISGEMMDAVIVELAQVNKMYRTANILSKVVRPLKKKEKAFKTGPLAGTKLKWNERTNILKNLDPDERALAQEFIHSMGRMRGDRKAEAVKLIQSAVGTKDEFLKLFGKEIDYINNLSGKDLSLFNKTTEFLRNHQGLLEEKVVGRSLGKTQMQARRYHWITKHMGRKGNISHTNKVAFLDEFGKKFPDLFDIKPTYFTPPGRIRKGYHKIDAEMQGRGLTTPQKLNSIDDLKNLRDILDNKQDWKLTPADIIAHNTHQTGRLLLQQNLERHIKNSGVAKRVKNIGEISDDLLRTNTIWTPGVTNKMLATMHKFGKSVEKMVKKNLTDPEDMRIFGIGPGEVRPDGLAGSLRKVFNTQFSREIFKDLKKMIEKGDEVYLIPKEMALTLDKQMGRTASVGLRMYDNTMSLWRNTVLHWNPGWYIQNALGNTILSMMGGHGFVDQAYWHLKGRGKSLEKYMPDELLAGMGPGTREVAEQLFKDARDPLDKLMLMSFRAASPDTLNKWANLIENKSRKTVFFSQMGKEIQKNIDQLKALGLQSEKAFDRVAEMLKVSQKPSTQLGKQSRKMIDDAVDHVNSTLFDYYNLSSFERDWVRRLFPFWTWTRNINMSMVRFAKRRMEHPLKNVAWQRLSRLGVEMRKDESFPRWLRHAVLWGGYEDGSFLFVDTRRHNPWLTVGMAGMDMAATSPLIKVAYERSTGINTWTKQPFKSGDVAVTYGGKLLRFKSDSGRPVAENFIPSVFTHMLDQFPQHYWIDNIIHPYLQTDDGNVFNPKPVLNMDGTPKYPKEQWLGIVSALGLPLRQLTGDQVKEMRKRKAQSKLMLINSLKKRLKHAPRDQRLFIKEMIRDVTKDRHRTLNEWERE